MFITMKNHVTQYNRENNRCVFNFITAAELYASLSASVYTDILVNRMNLLLVWLLGGIC